MFEQVRDRFNDNRTEFARAVGVKPSQIIGVLLGKKPFGPKFARSLEKKLRLPDRFYEGDAPLSDCTEVPLVRFKLSAGVTGFATEPDNGSWGPIYYRTDWLQKRGYDPLKLFAVIVSGDSMAPTICDDDLIVVDTSKVEPRDGVVMAINYEGELVVKRVRRESGLWWMTSDNADQRRYAPKKLNGESIVIGEVVYRQTSNI